MADRAYPLLLTTTTLPHLDAIDLRRGLHTMAELQALRVEHGIPTEVSLN